MAKFVNFFLGDSYERFQLSQVIIDYKERTNLIIEILSMKKLRVFDSLKYLHIFLQMRMKKMKTGKEE